MRTGCRRCRFARCRFHLLDTWQRANNNGDLLEQYWYDVDGARVKKTSGTTTTYTFFNHYEEEVTGAVTTAISHYIFGGERIAVKRGSDLYHLPGDHLGSASLTTDGAGAATASRADYANGAERAATARPTVPSPPRSPTPPA